MNFEADGGKSVIGRGTKPAQFKRSALVIISSGQFRMKRNLLIAAVILITIAAALAVADFTGLLHTSNVMLAISHWVAIVALVAYAAFRRTLGTWILVAMVAGAALGHDFPAFAVNLR